MSYRRLAWMLILTVAFFGSACSGSERSTRSETERSAGTRQPLPDAGGPPRPVVGTTSDEEDLPPVISIGDGVRRFSIEPTLETDGLCAWYQVSILSPQSEAYGESGGIDPTDCAIEVETIKPVVVVWGRSDLDVDLVAVLALAERKVERVVLRLEDGSSQELPLKKWAKTPWSWFSSDFHKRPFPDLVVAYDSNKRVLAKTDLGSRIRPACLVKEVCHRESERMSGQRINAYATDDSFWFPQAEARRTYELVTRSALLEEILGGRDYWVEDLGRSLTCDWKGQLGTWARVVLERRRGALEATWPYVELTPRGDDYVQREAHRRLAVVRALLVMLDRGGRIVAVDPYVGNTFDLTRFSDERVLGTTIDNGPQWVGQTDCNVD
jgi:hypothetical protein